MTQGKDFGIFPKCGAQSFESLKQRDHWIWYTFLKGHSGGSVKRGQDWNQGDHWIDIALGKRELMAAWAWVGNGVVLVEMERRESTGCLVDIAPTSSKEDKGKRSRKISRSLA